MRGKLYYAVILLLVFFLFFWTNVQAAFFFLLPILLAAPVSVFLNFVVSRFLDIQIRIEQDYEAAEGNAFQYNLHIKNRSYLPVFQISLQGVVRNLLTNTEEAVLFETSLAPKASKEYSFSVESRYCGRMDGDIREVWVYDFLGLSRFRIPHKSKGLCYVYPVPRDTGISEVCKMLREEYNQAEHYMHRRGNDITEILDIRDYQKGDNIKNIHWKLSKKLGHKVVRELDMPTNQDIILFFALSQTAQDDPECRDLTAKTVMGVIAELLQEQMNLDAVLFSEQGVRLGVYSIEGTESSEWYEHILLDGDISFEYAPVDQYIHNHHVMGKYSVVVLVSDEGLDAGLDAPNLIQITLS